MKPRIVDRDALDRRLAEALARALVAAVRAEDALDQPSLNVATSDSAKTHSTRIGGRAGTNLSGAA